MGHQCSHWEGKGDWFRGVGLYFLWRHDRETGDIHGEPRRVVVLGYEPMNGRGDRVVFREEGSRELKVFCTRTPRIESRLELIERGF